MESEDAAEISIIERRRRVLCCFSDMMSQSMLHMRQYFADLNEYKSLSQPDQEALFRASILELLILKVVPILTATFDPDIGPWHLTLEIWPWHPTWHMTLKFGPDIWPWVRALTYYPTYDLDICPWHLTLTLKFDPDICPSHLILTNYLSVFLHFAVAYLFIPKRKKKWSLATFYFSARTISPLWINSLTYSQKWVKIIYSSNKNYNFINV